MFFNIIIFSLKKFYIIFFLDHKYCIFSLYMTLVNFIYQNLILKLQYSLFVHKLSNYIMQKKFYNQLKFLELFIKQAYLIAEKNNLLYYIIIFELILENSYIFFIHQNQHYMELKLVNLIKLLNIVRYELYVPSLKFYVKNFDY